jgi:hypothetical protein
MKCLRSLPYVLSVLLLVLASISCASSPDAELQLVQTAMEEAQAQQAADFAAADWQDAMQVWNEAQTALADQSYSNAKALLITAKIRFEKVGSIAKAKRESVLQEVQILQTTLNKGLDSLKSSIATSRFSPNRRKEFDEAAKEVEFTIMQFNAEMDKGDIARARISGQEAIKKLNEVQLKLASPAGSTAGGL